MPEIANYHVNADITPLVLVMNDDYFLPYALSSIEKYFSRFVIYNVGSTDGTENIIDWFIERNKSRCSFYVRHLPFVPPDIQGIFRNSMIAESQSEMYFLLDGDEVYSNEDMVKLKLSLNAVLMQQGKLLNVAKPYGVFRRIEIGEDLQTRYDEIRSHHRLYHRTAIWKGTHPGEEPVLEQKPSREVQMDLICHHFHNAVRSSDSVFEVPRRKQRKERHTYRPGSLVSFDVLKALPILRKPIENFPVSPELERLQKEWV